MLEHLGLTQYLQVFIDEGFDSWETLCDITESDLDTLHVKLGHRRKLQRAIIEARGRTRDNVTLGAPSRLGSGEETYRSDLEDDHLAREQRSRIANNLSNLGGQKRRYRRHPKPDEHAPERPPSAYVLFSNQMRDELKGQDLGFSEIAKIVGERWQNSAPTEKEPCEREAQATKEKYAADLKEYKRTTHYADYQAYLADFKAKHGSQSENKRSKVEHSSSITVPSSAQDSGVLAWVAQSSPISEKQESPNQYQWHSHYSPTMQRQSYPGTKPDLQLSRDESSSSGTYSTPLTIPTPRTDSCTGSTVWKGFPAHTVPDQPCHGYPSANNHNYAIPHSQSATRLPQPSDNDYPPSAPQLVPRGNSELPPLQREEMQPDTGTGHILEPAPWSSSNITSNRMLPLPSTLSRADSRLQQARYVNETRSYINAAYADSGSKAASSSSIATLLAAGNTLALNSPKDHALVGKGDGSVARDDMMMMEQEQVLMGPTNTEPAEQRNK
ncbi:hypothetical protein AAFC00_003561 [Neodothiora populina]|uniref:HMG box domain-containing protein n=1 Tax=Neodothiora populina TaxID=2781224 RepID=A0ABR3PEK5_9PEZI